MKKITIREKIIQKMGDLVIFLFICLKSVGLTDNFHNFQLKITSQTLRKQKIDSLINEGRIDQRTH
jgi:hypothetical protein